MVFKELYRSAVIEALGDFRSFWAECPIEDMAGMVECAMVEQFDKLERIGFQSWKLREDRKSVV